MGQEEGQTLGPMTLARTMLSRRVVSTTSSLLTCSGNWLSPFDPAFTEVDTFRLDKYKTVKVPMMYRAGNFASTFDKNFRCHVLKLPYQGNATMLVVLMEKMGDHFALEDYLTTDLVDTWLRNMKTRYSMPLALHELSLPSPQALTPGAWFDAGLPLWAP